MSKTFAFTKKSVLGLFTAGLLGATVLTSTLVTIPTAPLHAEQAQVFDQHQSLAPLVDKVMPSVVSIEVKFTNAAAVVDNNNGDGALPDQMPPGLKDFFDQFPQFKNRIPQAPQGGGMALGSGFVITSDGYVVTNNHVVERATEVKVAFQNGDKYDATVIGTDPKTDLALLKIKSDKTFPFVSFTKTEAKVGDYVMAVGNPFGLGGTVTAGIVSARGRDIGSGPYDDFIQVDASINKGNSGGPTFNMNGEVVGINTAIFSPSGGSVGIGFAIPASTAQGVIDSLKTNHKVTRGWLGVQIQPVTADLAESMGLVKAKGAIISDLTQGSPALKAGLKTGDTILKVDGTEILDARDLAKNIAHVTPGKTVQLAIIRGGKPMTVDVVLAAMPTDPTAPAAKVDVQKTGSLSSFGLEVTKADDGAGVKITKVDPKSSAADQGLKQGDVILEVAGTEVNDPTAASQALKSVSGKKVLMLVRSADGQRYVALPTGNG
ncbi:MAG: Do family serine endopeptidase [Alphaproteobacteria bacterium]|nr:Do family serine endopeptidase [Alphaproteobacteria bacterium]